MKIFELSPVNNRKSFYSKCKVVENSNISTLISFNTKVAEYNKETKKMTVKGYFSSTTSAHINAFLNYYGFKTCSKKELENYNS